MNMDFIGFTLQIIGEIMIGFTAIMVHYRFRKEHKVDEEVFQTMKQEHFTGVAGIALLIVGYLIQLPGIF